jgi:protoheme ferro-lyase
MVCLNSFILSFVGKVEQKIKDRQLQQWIDYRQYVEYIKDRIREKWKQQAPTDTFW